MIGFETATGGATGGLLTLKHGDMFGVFDERGDVRGGIAGSEARVDGVFMEDTRVLSTYALELQGAPPRLLGGGLTPDGALATLDATNPPFVDRAGRAIEEGTIHLRRRRYLLEGEMREVIGVTHHGQAQALVDLTLRFGADFRDLFEVRGARRPKRGRMQATTYEEQGVTLSYLGLDDRELRVDLAFSRAPTEWGEGWVRLELSLPPGGRDEIFVTLRAFKDQRPRPDRVAFVAGLRTAQRTLRRAARPLRRLGTSNERFNRWLERSSADLALLSTQLETGPYPYAGIPWFSAPFGRDALVTALQTLWLDPRWARGVLGFLAHRQAEATSSFHDSGPGKILHETRHGEMSRLGETPFRGYFGGVDSTPLFVVLAGAHLERTGDLAFAREVWPAVARALDWVQRTRAGGRSQVFLEYARGEDSGIRNQGWKDSDEAVFHADGRLAEGPVALVEVQAYVYGALRAAAGIARRLGEPSRADALLAEAAALRIAFEEAFWSESLGLYALALDGEGARCEVRSSNAGHVLLTGIAAPDRAAQVARALTTPAFASGWGLRTVPTGEARYNPMSYHNGSVWPHDVSLVAAGLGRAGHRSRAARLLGDLFDAAQRFDHRLPELFCGFQRRGGENPVAYPEACVPQAWAAGAPYLLLQASLGIAVDGLAGKVIVDRPALPRALDTVEVHGLAVGSGSIDLRIERAGDRVRVEQLGGEIELEIHR